MSNQEANVKIARIMGWTNNNDYGMWIKPDGFSKNNPETPPLYCSDNSLAAEFRQHTMRQPWATTLCEYVYGGKYTFYFINNPHGFCGTAETEAAASSLACLAAWEAVEGTK